MRLLLSSCALVALLSCSPKPQCNAGEQCTTGGGDGGGGVSTGGGGGGGAGGGGAVGGGGGGDSDVTPPQVQSVTPAHGATGVGQVITLELVFSEPMNPQSVAVVSSPSLGFATPVWFTQATSLRLTPTTNLAAFTDYTFTVTGADLAGNALAPAFSFSFRTAPSPDVTVPTLVSTQPANAATAVPTNTELHLTFSESMNGSTVQVLLTPAAALGATAWATEDTELTIAPVAPLSGTTTYVATVTGADRAGNPLANDTTFTFTTAAPADVTPPRLVGSTPAPDAGNVPADTQLVLTFDEPMNPSSLNLAIFPAAPRGSPVWSNQDRTATFSAPPAPWADATDYVVDLTASDLAANAMTASLQFTTAPPPDTTPPTVTGTVPAANDPTVLETSTIELTFSEPMNQAATQAAFSTTPPTTCTFTWNAARTTMSARPSAPLEFNRAYLVTLGAGARDDANNTLASPFTFGFTTAPMAPDTTAPIIVSTTPLDAAVGVPRFSTGTTPTAISIQFNEAMNQASAEAAFQVTSPTGFGGGAFTWLGNVMTYTPPAAFAFGAQVTFELGVGATDLAGNALASTLTGTFRMRREATTRFYASGITNTGGTSALDGYVVANISCSSVSLVSYPHGSAIGGDTTFAGQVFRGYMSFNMSHLDTLANVNITAATLNAQQVAVNGSPLSLSFGSAAEAWHVSYGATLTAAACSTPNLGGRQYTLSVSLTLGPRSVSVLPAVRDDYLNRVARGHRSQFMIRTATLASVGTITDSISFGTFNQLSNANDPYLNVTYQYD